MSQISKCPKLRVVLGYWEALGEVSELRYKNLLYSSSQRSYCILCPHCLVDTDMNKLHFSILKFDPPQPLNSNPKTYFDFNKSCSTPWKPTHSPERLTFQEAAASTILALWSLCRHCDIFIRIQISQWLWTWGATSSIQPKTSVRIFFPFSRGSEGVLQMTKIFNKCYDSLSIILTKRAACSVTGRSESKCRVAERGEHLGGPAWVWIWPK